MVIGQEGVFVLQQLLLIRPQESIIGLLSQSPVPSTLRVPSARRASYLIVGSGEFRHGVEVGGVSEGSVVELADGRLAGAAEELFGEWLFSGETLEGQFGLTVLLADQRLHAF